MSSKRSRSLAKPSPDQMNLIIDTSDTYSNIENYFYINPSNLAKIKSLSSEQFSSVIIKNTKIDLITPLILTNLFTKMKINGKGEIIISEPISVMQSFEAKTIIANLKIGGFDEIKINDSFFFDEKYKKKIPTLSVNFIRPEKRGNLQEETYKKYENKINKLSEKDKGGIKRKSINQNMKNSSSNKRINTQNESSKNLNIPRSGKRLSTQSISPNKLDNVPANRRLSRPIEDTNVNKNNISRGNVRRSTESNVNDRSSKYSRRK